MLFSHSRSLGSSRTILKRRAVQYLLSSYQPNGVREGGRSFGGTIMMMNGRLGSCCPSTIVSPCRNHMTGDVCRTEYMRLIRTKRRHFGSTPPSSASSPSAPSSSPSSSSVSDREVSKFSQFAKSWWDANQNPLIGMNSIRVQYIVSQVEQQRQHNSVRRENEKQSILAGKPLHGLKALDVGCGGGILTESLARLGATVTAIDPSTQLVEQAKQHSYHVLDPESRGRIQYLGGLTVEELADDEDKKFDVICLLEVLEHVTDLESIVGACKRLLKPQTGKLFVSTINQTIKSQLLAIIGAEYIMRYLPPGTHDYNKFLSPHDVNQLMYRFDLRPVDTQGMIITQPPPPIGNQWNWTLDPNDTDVNWIGSYQSAASQGKN